MCDQDLTDFVSKQTSMLFFTIKPAGLMLLIISAS